MLLRLSRISLVLLIFVTKGYSLCTRSFPSSTGYTLTVSIDTKSVIVRTLPCPYGYNYDLILGYTVTAAGTNTPSSLYTLQGNVSCAGQSTFYDLPNQTGVGTVTTNVNMWIGTNGGTAYNYVTYPSCYAVNPSNLNCNITWIIVEAPGIAYQNVNCGSASTLPIELSDFKATKTDEGVSIEWETKSEKNSSFFDVERSVDGINWTVIKKVKGSGNTFVEQSYSVIDEQPAIGLNYYRLKQIDVDLNYTYSPIIYILSSPTGFLVSHIKPNPTENDIYFQIKTPASGSANFRFIDESGTLVKSGSFEYHQGISDVTLSLQEIKTGFYLLEIDFGKNGQRVYKKISKL